MLATKTQIVGSGANKHFGSLLHSFIVCWKTAPCSFGSAHLILSHKLCPGPNDPTRVFIQKPPRKLQIHANSLLIMKLVENSQITKLFNVSIIIIDVNFLYLSTIVHCIDADVDLLYIVYTYSVHRRGQLVTRQSRAVHKLTSCVRLIDR